MEFIDLALAFGMLQLPHPLLGHDVNFRGIARRSTHVEVQHSSAYEHHHHYAQGNDGPADFKQERAFNLCCLATMAAAIFRRENRNHREDEDSHRYADSDEKNV